MRPMISKLKSLIRSDIVQQHVKQFTRFGIALSIVIIFIGTLLGCYQLNGYISFRGMVLAQQSIATLWLLDLAPFLFAAWGYFFAIGFVEETEHLIEERTQEFVNRRGDLESTMQFKSHHDGLTSLPNVQLLLPRIAQGIQKLNEKDELAVLVIRINKFKEINYQFGSFGANSLLVQFAEQLKAILLEPFMLQPYMGMNMVARLQGSEFAILMPRLRADHQFEDLLEKISQMTQMDFVLDGKSVKATATIGVALCSSDSESEEILLHRASVSLQWSEKEDKPYAIYNAKMDQEFKNSETVLGDLNTAIARDAYSLLFVPRYTLTTKKIVGAEAVVHFEDEKYGTVHANKLLTLVEGGDIKHALCASLLKHAIEQLGTWQRGKQKMPLSVQLIDLSNPKLPQYIASLLEENQVSPKLLTLEISEKACLTDKNNAKDILLQLSKTGIKLVVSDFCSGFTSFEYLTQFPIDAIKIDQNFIKRLSSDTQKLKTVRTMVNVAKTLKLETVASGIENEETFVTLQKLGCKLGQGTFLSNPLTASGLLKLVE